MKSNIFGSKIMREYITAFFRDFEYDNADAAYLISVYDKITSNEEAAAILADAIAAYTANINIDYKEEILGRSRKISTITAIHPYTVDLLVYICLTKKLKELYTEKCLDMQIYRDSVLDLKWKLLECKAVKGICGSFVAGWFAGFFKLKRFALGRLQFELITINKDYEKDGIKLEKDKSQVINVHIPRTGTPMDKESCDKAYAAAREFFRNEVGENCAFVCHSWLLYPENKNILPSHTNIYRFMSEYDIIDWGFNEGQDLWRLFDTHEMNPDRLPANGSLRRAYVEHLKRGGRVGWGFGVKI